MPNPTPGASPKSHGGRRSASGLKSRTWSRASSTTEWIASSSAAPRPELRALRVVQTNTGDDFWSVHEFRILDGIRELARAAHWRLTAHPYPWGVQDAFDNSLATFWICGDTLKPGQFLTVDFQGEETADAVVIETAPNQPAVRLRLEGLDDTGRWQVLAAAPQVSDAAHPLGLRRAIAEELKRRGIDYLLVFDREE